MTHLSRVTVLSLSFLLLRLSHGIDCDASSYTIANGEIVHTHETTLYCDVPYLFTYSATTQTQTGGYVITCDSQLGTYYMKDPLGPDFYLDKSSELCIDCRVGGCGNEGTCTDGLCVCDAGFNKDTGGTNVVCSPDTCDKPVVDHATFDPDVDPYPAGTSVTITCDAGYIYPNGAGLSSVTIDCQGSGSGFSETPETACLICEDDTQCTNGKCSGGICVCDINFQLVTGSTTVCEAMVCPANHCGAYGDSCRIANSQPVCTCTTGASGDKCETLAADPCLTSPCVNGGVCWRDPGNLALAVCACDDTQFNGDSCQFLNEFHIPAGGQIKYTDLKSMTVEFSFVPSDDPMILLKFKAESATGADVKPMVVFISAPQSGGGHSLMLGGKDATVMGQVNTGATNKFMLDIRSSQLHVSVNDDAEITIMASDNIEDVIVGGGECLWYDISDECLGESRWFYTPFVGSLTKIAIDGVPETSGDLQTYGAVSGNFNCNAFTCENRGVCDDSSGSITCTCAINTEGRTGFACDKMKSPSFNGYSSSYSVDTEVVNIHDINIIDMKIETSGDTGTAAVVTIDQCTLSFELLDGKVLLNGKTDMEVTGVVSIKDGVAYLDDPNTSAPCVIDASPVKHDINVSLGGVAPEAGSGKTIADSHFQGCIVQLTFNDKNLLMAGGDSSDIDTEQCVSDLFPASPCEDAVSPCQNDMPCSIDMDDYSAVCACETPYDKDDICSTQDYCEINTCDSDGTEECHTITVKSVEACKTDTGFGDEECEKIVSRDEWFYFCTCNDRYEGLNCDVELSAPEPVKDNTTTTVIIVVVVVVGVIILVVVAVLVMRKRRSGDAAKANGKTKGEYKPQAEEKLEMGAGKNGDHPPNNIYDEAGTVLKNPTAESEPTAKEVEAEVAAPAELAVTVDPEEVEVEAGIEEASPAHI